MPLCPSESNVLPIMMILIVLGMGRAFTIRMPLDQPHDDDRGEGGSTIEKLADDNTVLFRGIVPQLETSSSREQLSPPGFPVLKSAVDTTRPRTDTCLRFSSVQIGSYVARSQRFKVVRPKLL